MTCTLVPVFCLLFCGKPCLNWNQSAIINAHSFSNSLITFKLAINIVLLGISCNLIDQHRRNLEDKVNKALGGQSASLPASRHNSVTELTILDEEEKLIEIKEKIIEQTPNKQTNKSSINLGTRSTPHSPNTSPRHSLEDITEHLQNTLESSIILSDSTVSLISMNDGQNLHLPQDGLQKENSLKPKHKVNSPRRKLFSLTNFPNLKRRVSLQERTNNDTYADDSTDEKQLDGNIGGKSKASWHLTLLCPA